MLCQLQGVRFLLLTGRQASRGTASESSRGDNLSMYGVMAVSMMPKHQLHPGSFQKRAESGLKWMLVFQPWSSSDLAYRLQGQPALVCFDVCSSMGMSFSPRGMGASAWMNTNDQTELRGCCWCIRLGHTQMRTVHARRRLQASRLTGLGKLPPPQPLYRLLALSALPA